MQLGKLFLVTILFFVGVQKASIFQSEAVIDQAFNVKQIFLIKFFNNYYVNPTPDQLEDFLNQNLYSPTILAFYGNPDGKISFATNITLNDGTTFDQPMEVNFLREHFSNSVFRQIQNACIKNLKPFMQENKRNNRQEQRKRRNQRNA